MFPMQVTEKIFRPLRQPLNSCQIDNLTSSRLNRRVFSGQKSQVRYIPHIPTSHITASGSPPLVYPHQENL